MNGHAFPLSGAALVAMPSGALFWPAETLLCVSDLHLGKSERLARRGGMLLPPYETLETLTRLDEDLVRSGARRVVCLGDSFDDAEAADSLSGAEMQAIVSLMAGRDWTWIAGNHDPGPLALGGAHRAALRLGPLVFRHIAEADAKGEVSGHYHPKASLAGQSRPCFLLDSRRLILPAYGTFTGGLRTADPALEALMLPGALALLTGPRTLPIPMPRGPGQTRPRLSSISR